MKTASKKTTEVAIAELPELSAANPTISAKKSAKKKETAPAKEEKVEETLPPSVDEQFDALVKEVLDTPKPVSKRRSVAGAVIKDEVEGDKPAATVKTTKAKAGKPWGKYGAHGQNQSLEGFAEGDNVVFTLKGKEVTGTFSHFHVNNHSPKGYLVIKMDGKIYERVLAKVSMIDAKEPEAPVAPVVEPVTEAKKKATKTKK